MRTTTPLIKYYKALRNAFAITALGFATKANAQQLAFPGAEGFGRFATGGRGGEVYHVTNLNDTGYGSFRDAVSKPNRTIVFDVTGVIKIVDKIKAAPKITIAGQTAPGQGIVVYGNGVSFADSSIIRYMRFRGSINMPRGACTVVADDCKDVIFDHVSIAWGRWDNLHIKNSNNITLQYCLIGESIDPQRFGALFENPTNVTVHHSLWIDNSSRNPKAKAGIEYINNVIYNWGTNGFVGGHSGADHTQDIVNNYFIAGPNSGKAYMGMFSATDKVFHKGNYVDMNKDGKLNGRLLVDSDFVQKGVTLLKAPTYMPVVSIDNAADAYKKVVESAGASLQRDAVDARIIGYLKSLGKAGQIFKTEADAGGQPELPVVEKLVDSNNDGIPDKWDAKFQANNANGEGYTRLEKYLNAIIKLK
ncbi:pectate lyase family protein [Mucilaginibacter terrae]|uniref:Pectate lyase n=1 Tax=Mucilaginibacter terrae TaxID=1955052 RepID=A0ABU3GQQ9_9SPHI|nr:hypothetical protein [Mucilaginibacter terrae]MDT3402122.1 hypothetical protein [Mucilaginibacter terrae]